jgi:hypothetical protein
MDGYRGKLLHAIGDPLVPTGTQGAVLGSGYTQTPSGLVKSTGRFDSKNTILQELNKFSHKHIHTKTSVSCDSE